MIKNYLTIAWRNLWRHKILSFINISGLSLGLACCILIILYTKDEISFDRFHKNEDRLARLTCLLTDTDGKKNKIGDASMIQGATFKEEIPEIEDFVRVNNRRFLVKNGNETFNDNASWVDDNFFSIFTFPLLSGDPKTALKDPNSIVLTDETAKKYFGTTDVIGKTLELEVMNKFELFKVTGVAQNPPQNSSIKFNMLLPFSFYKTINPDDHWISYSFPTFFLMRPNVDFKKVEDKMATVFESKSKIQMLEERKIGFKADVKWGIQSFSDMHFDTEIPITPEVSNPIYSYILSVIAFFILLIACINFINLTVAQSLRRSKEIGVRKVVGGQRSQLIIQFLGESFLLCFISFALAILLAKISLPLFNELSNKKLALSYLFDYQLITGFGALFLLTGFIVGFYPAIVLSSFDPVKTLYNRFKLSGKNYLSKSLMVVQFSLATFMIITTFFIHHQFDFLTHKTLGYNEKNLVLISVPIERDVKKMNTIKEEFGKQIGVENAALCINGNWGTIAKANGKELNVTFDHIDENFLPTMQIPLVGGRNFSKDFSGDSTNSVIVNEAFIKAMGWEGSGVDKNIDHFNGKDKKLQIVGVVKDYHFASLKEKIKPLLFTVTNDLPFRTFLIRIDNKNVAQTINALEKTFKSFFPYRPFKYDFEEDLVYKSYEKEARWKNIIAFAAILTVFISCIGLFGLTMLSAERHTKEIGIRKVLGASVSQVVMLLSKDFITIVLTAFIIAVPLAWYAVSKWLQDFAYRIDISWWIFALAGATALLIGLLSVSFQAIKAAVANPVKSLRTE